MTFLGVTFWTTQLPAIVLPTLAVITLGIVVALGFLSGAISSALDSVTAIL